MAKLFRDFLCHEDSMTLRFTKNYKDLAFVLLSALVSWWQQKMGAYFRNRTLKKFTDSRKRILKFTLLKTTSGFNSTDVF